MKRLSILILILSIFPLISCQVKETSPTGGLISSHSPTTNKFTLQSTPSKTYIVGETIYFELSFPFEMVVNTTSGSPQLRITVGSLLRNATFTPSSDLKKLIFQYKFVDSDNDSDGIEVNSLVLNGSLIKFNVNGTTYDCDVSTLSSTSLPLVKVDGASPTLNSFSIGNFPRLHHLGDEMRFVLTYSESVFVTGTPKLIITLSSGTVIDVNYTTGSGSDTLIFSFNVASNHVALSGYNNVASLISLSGGTIKDAVGNDASLNLESKIPSLLGSSLFYPFDGEIPHVTDVTLPEDKTYVASESLDFVLNFDRPVAVSSNNKPYLALTIGANSRQAQYFSGTGTQSIIFRYTLIPGDEDLNGIDIAASIIANSSTITSVAAPGKNYFSNNANNSLLIPSTKNILANAIQPRAISISRNTDSYSTTSTTDNTWVIGQNLDLTVGFNTQMFVTQTMGTPSLSLIIGSTTRQATYLSGGNGQTSLIFRYTIQEGDLDSDNSIGLGTISLNGGVICDEANTNSLLSLPVSTLTSTKIDGIRPSITSMGLPQNGVYSTVSPLTSFEFKVTWSEPVILSSTASSATYLSLILGSDTVNANYASGSNTNQLTFRYLTSLAGKNDSDGIALNTTINGSTTLRDAAGNIVLTKTLPTQDTSGILIDTTAPTVQSVNHSLANGTYSVGANLDFVVNFSEPVNLTRSGSDPNIVLNVGTQTKLLEAITTGSSSTHTFRYTVGAEDTDSDGITIIGNINKSVSGSIVDNGRNSIVGTFTPPSTTGIIIDAETPKMLSVYSPAQKTYSSPETMDIILSYSENVFVTDSPKIPITISSGNAFFNYHSGSGTTNLTFRFSISPTDYDLDGLPSSVSSISGGSIKDQAGNSALTSFDAIDLSSIFVTFPNTDLWIKPEFTNLSANPLVTTSQSGDVTTLPCGSDFCREFNDGDNLEMTSQLTNVISLYMIIQLPPVASGTHEIFGSDIKLVEDTNTGNFDLYAPGIVEVDGMISGPGPVHDLDLTPGSTKLIFVRFSVPLIVPQGQLLFGSSFSGGIGEILAVTESLSEEQENAVLNYLADKFQ